MTVPVNETPVTTLGWKVGLVSGRVLRAVADIGPGDDTLPDVLPAKGDIIFTPKVLESVIPGSPSIRVRSETITASLDAEGYISRNFSRGIWLWAGTWNVNATSVGATTMRLNIPTVANWTVNGYTNGVSIIAGVSTPEMVPLFNTKLTQDLSFELDNDLNFFRIRGCRLFSSVVSGSGKITDGGRILLSNAVYRVPRAAFFGVAFSYNANDMLTESVNFADDVFKHVFSTFEFDSHGKHMKSAFFGMIQQSKLATDNSNRLTITNPGSGEYSYMKTGVFY